jgi:hypothetical protein
MDKVDNFPEKDGITDPLFDRIAKFPLCNSLRKTPTTYISGNGPYQPYILFSEKKEYLFFHTQVSQTEKENLISKIHEVLEPLDVYGEVVQIEGVVLIQDQVEFYNSCMNFFNRETPLYERTEKSILSTNFREPFEMKHNDIADVQVENAKAKYSTFINNIKSSYDTMRNHFIGYEIYDRRKYDYKRDNDYYVLYNIPQKVCMVVNDKDVSRHMWSYIDDFVVGESKCIEHYISYFHMKSFESFDSVKNYMKQWESTLNIKKPNYVTDGKKNEKTMVVSYIKTNYDFNNSDEPEFRKNSEDLFNELQANINIDNSEIYQFRIRLSKYLQELGINKKRFTIGYFYYGMVRKYSKYIKQDLKHINLHELEESRNNELQEILSSMDDKTKHVGPKSLYPKDDGKVKNSNDIIPMEHICGIDEPDSDQFSRVDEHTIFR